MNAEQLKSRFFSLVAPDLPNEWDVDDAVEHLQEMEPGLLDAALSQVPVIWPVSNSLCFSYLSQVSSALACITTDLLPKWVNTTLDHYERSGLKAAQRFMADVQGHFVCRLQGKSGLRFSQVEGRLLPYARGLAGGALDLREAAGAGTDTAVIFLPATVSLFDVEEENFLLYKLMISFQWGYITLGTFNLHRGEQPQNPSVDGRLWLEDYFSAFEEPACIADIYHGIETLRVRTFLDRELPGLMRDAQHLLPRTAQERRSDAVGGFLNDLQQLICRRDTLLSSRYLTERFEPILSGSGDAEYSLVLAKKLYDDLFQAATGYQPVAPLPFQGEMMLPRVAAAQMEQRQQQESLFVEGLATLLLHLPPHRQHEEHAPREEESNRAQAVPAAEDGTAIVLGQGNGAKAEQDRPREPRSVIVDNREIELGEDLAELAAQIEQDLGQIPDHYITSAAGRAGQGQPDQVLVVPAEGAPVSAPITYDEWDYRRSGFRRDWCIVTEKEIPLTRTTFIRSTLDNYHGQIIRLRHQFEMMRTSERFVRRQRDGDDIDLDALVESLADTVAGQPPSDRLFVRLQRDERDIAALFLVDMSNSTRGWVGKGIKESLVLICEAMESLGDRYGIYGFSGMRRLRCEVFPIKNIDQPYDDGVRERIGSIAPREYTRMAPAIRHMTSILETVDAKVRLLITLSDGKPEDYDDYKGEYAIEDTRHALIEAKMAGIHPFCITIDRHAHEYMAHMYGEVNYIVIDDVRRLPARMPEIYRVLTT